MLYYITFSLISFLVFLVAHVVIFHKKPPQRRFRSMILTCLCAVVFYIVTALVFKGTGLYPFLTNLIPEIHVDFFNGVFLYLFICFFYFHLIIVFDSSVTTRMMVEFEKSRDKKLKLDELKRAYSLEEKFENELVDMQFLDRIAAKLVNILRLPQIIKSIKFTYL